MSTTAQLPKCWIKNPATDLTFFDFGWILVFLPLIMLKEHIAFIILVVLIVNYIHRHYTFALVYGDKEEFEKRKKIYVFLPIVAVIVTFISIYFDGFKILVLISVLWTMYHTITQKYGITRIYSRKAGYGEAWIEKGVIYSWFVYLFFALAEREKDVLQQYQSGKVFISYVGDYFNYLTLASYFFLAVSVFFTLLFAYQEFKNRHQISAAKNIFVNSKYKKKPDSRSPLAMASKKQWVYSSFFSIGIVALCLIGIKFNENAFEIYIVGSSFLHFIYDGLIWKVRRPEVGKPLDIKYAT